MPTYEDDLDQMRAELEHFNLTVEDTKRYFGDWDAYDPVVWAILRVAAAQNDLAYAIGEVAC